MDSCHLHLSVAIADCLKFCLLLWRQLVVDLNELLIGVVFHQGVQFTQGLRG